MVEAGHADFMRLRLLKRDPFFVRFELRIGGFFLGTITGGEWKILEAAGRKLACSDR